MIAPYVPDTAVLDVSTLARVRHGDRFARFVATKRRIEAQLRTTPELEVPTSKRDLVSILSLAARVRGNTWHHNFIVVGNSK